MEWTQVRVTGALCDRDRIAAVMCMLDNGLLIEDYSDIDMKTVYADLIDEEILKKDKTRVSVSLFVPPERSVAEYIAFLRERFSACDIRAEIETVGVEEEAWATAWKQYYKPLHIGKRLVVVPQWENYTKQPGELILTMDPGMAFGTGTHETTRLCAGLLEDCVTEQTRMLDVGTGSGILALSAALLGAGTVFSCDIDPVAVRVAGENIALNGMQSRVRCAVSDLLASVPAVQGGYTLVTANIVADVIMRMAPQLPPLLAPGCAVITSGIIDPRAEEVRSFMTAHGFIKEEEAHENGWCAYLFRYPGGQA